LAQTQHNCRPASTDFLLLHVMTRSEILDFLKMHKDELRQIYGVQEIALFGSYARQTARDDSDIDIAIELADEKKTLTNFFGLKRYLEEHLGKRIDLGIKSTMKPIVKETAQKDMLHV
jgi:predicted nucleotidyltransferase